MSDTAVQSSSNATEKSDTSLDVAIEAGKLIGLGRRNLLVGDAPGAVQVLQEACSLLATKYGETGAELGEAYFHYGSALLELGRMESGVLGNALHGVDPQTEDEDDAEDETVESAEKVQGEERKKVLKEVDEALESIPDKTTDDAKDSKDGKDQEDKKDEAMETDEKSEDKKEKVAQEEQPKDAKSEQEKVEQKMDDNKAESKKDDKAEQKKDDKVEPQKDNKVEQKDSESTKDEEKAKTAEKKDDGAGPSTADDGEAKDKEDGEAEDKEDGEADTAEDTAEGDTADENTEKEEEGEGEDISNFQLCWEILELARVIFGKNEDKDYKLKVAQVHLKLGELGLETEQYPQSIEDFTQCLNIQKEHLEPESRLLAETHYNLGLAFSSDSRFSDAIEHFEAAKKVIEAKVTLLEKRVKENEGEGKGKEKADADDPVVKDRKEIAELQDLLPEITAKLEDAKDSKKSAASAASQAIAAAAAEFGLGGGSLSSNPFGAPSSSTSQVAAKPIQVRKAGGDAPATDISHLVKRKRKSEEPAVENKEADGATSPTDAKRIKPDDKGDAAKTNGHANGAVNGHAKSPDKQEAKPAEKKMNGDATPAAAMETS